MTAVHDEPRIVRIEQARDGSWWKVFADGERRGMSDSEARWQRDQGHPEVPAPARWAALDLSAYLDGSAPAVTPTLLMRRDSAALAYPGRVHWLSGEPEALKTWLALLACAQAIHDGQRTVYIDFEDSPGGVVSRLLAIGVPGDAIRDRFSYHQPDGPINDRERAALTGAVTGAAVLVIDACTEALAAQGLSSKDDTDIAEWLTALPRWAAKLGPAVLVLDHVVKDSDNRGRWASGSGHKLAGLDGVAYTLEAVQPGGVGMTGRSRLYVSKDRHGQVRPHSVPTVGGKHWLADLVVDSTGPFVDIALHPPAVHDGPFIPTVVMTKVSEALAAAGRPLTKSEIEDRVTGRAQIVRQAIAALDDAGHLEVKPGPHNSRLHHLLKPYPEADT